MAHDFWEQFQVSNSMNFEVLKNYRNAVIFRAKKVRLATFGTGMSSLNDRIL